MWHLKLPRDSEQRNDNMETMELDRIIGDFPPRIRKPMKTLVGWMQKNQVTREDFSKLRWAIELERRIDIFSYEAGD